MARLRTNLGLVVTAILILAVSHLMLWPAKSTWVTCRDSQDNEANCTQKADGPYVMMSVSLTMDSARRMDYMFLLPVTCLNWHRKGYHSLVVLVADTNLTSLSHGVFAVVLTRLKKMQEQGIVTIYVMENVPHDAVVSVTQMVRLFLPIFDRSIPDFWANCNDADMWICTDNGREVSGVDISARSPLGFHDKMVVGEQKLTCGQRAMYPMAMKISLWRTIFANFIPESSNFGPVLEVSGVRILPQPLSLSLLKFLKSSFGYDGRRVKHGGGGFWFMDQVTLACGVRHFAGYARISDINLGDRWHIWDAPVENTCQSISDIHLAKFTLDHYDGIKHLFSDPKLFDQNYEGSMVNYISEYYAEFKNN